MAHISCISVQISRSAHSRSVKWLQSRNLQAINRLMMRDVTTELTATKQIIFFMKRFIEDESDEFYQTDSHFKSRMKSWFSSTSCMINVDLYHTHGRNQQKYRVWVLYCIVSIHLHSSSWSAQKSEEFSVRETQTEESSFERTKRGTWLASVTSQ